jgi:hypothetical protein
MSPRFKCFFTEFGRDCLRKLERLGDEALKSKNYSDAIKQYTAVKPLIGDLDLKHELLLKRSEAHAEIGPENWREALDDAEEVVLFANPHILHDLMHISTRQSD